MPAKDGTGPMGTGARGGRCLRLSADTSPAASDMRFEPVIIQRKAFGRNLRYGFRRGCFANQPSFSAQKDVLSEEKMLLQNRLEIIEKRIGKL